MRRAASNTTARHRFAYEAGVAGSGLVVGNPPDRLRTPATKCRRFAAPNSTAMRRTDRIG
jgi:hypothetical protein